MFFFFFFSILILFFAMMIWWRDVNRESTSGDHNFEVFDGFKWGMTLFIFSEIMFFAGWFWAFFHNSLVPANDLGVLWPPFYLICLEPFQIPFLNTIVLLSSGITVTVAHYMMIQNKNSQILMLMTISLGFFFSMLQGSEYMETFFSVSENSYGSSFFITTGFHGIHVIIGSSYLLYCFFFFKMKDLSKWSHTSLEFAIWYWHFVDVVWLFLFFFMYWWSFYSKL